MATQITTRPKQTALQAPSGTSYTEDQKQIMMALGAAVIFRGGEADESYLDPMTRRLSKEPTERVLKALERIGEAERQDGEPAVPSLGRVLREVVLLAESEHPLAHLRMIVRKLAKNWSVKVDEDLLRNFEEVAGHRTDADLDTACKNLLRDETIRKFPTAGMLLSACGVMRERRDGAKVE